jgi:CHAT domain-containing protein
MYIRFFVLIVGLFWSCNSLAQDNSDYPWEQFHSDVKSRNFEKPIAFLKNNIANMESAPDNIFSDSTYIGMTTILSSIYIQSNMPYAADSLLNHAIDFFIQSKKTSQLAYALYLAYGGLLAHLQNYSLAKLYFNSVVDFLKNKPEAKENYAIALSMMALCHQNTDSLLEAKSKITEAINIIEKVESQFSLSNKISIYQKAGAIFYELGSMDEANKYMQMAYDLSEHDDMFVTEFISSSLNLSISLQNQGKYQESIKVLHMLENKPLTDSEAINVFQNLFLAYYFLNNEDETVKYADLCSDYIKEVSSIVMSSFPTFTIEDIWQKLSIQLKVNMGVLEKYKSNKTALSMSYDNALFLKNYSFRQMECIRAISKSNEKIGNLINDIKLLKSKILAGDTSYYKELNVSEKSIISELKNMPDNVGKINIRTWYEVKQSLKSDECAIEIVSYSGFVNSDSIDSDYSRLKYGALIILPSKDFPVFVELCSFQELSNVLVNAIIDNEFGINELYKKGSHNVLYNLIWENIEKQLKGIKTVYISPILDLQDINIGYIPCQDGYYLNEKYEIRIVSSTSVICNTPCSFRFADTSIYGGVQFSRNSKKDLSNNRYRSLLVNELTYDTRGGFGYLQSSEHEVDSIFKIVKHNHYEAKLYKGADANERSFRKQDGKASSIIHLATHGFYFAGFNKYMDYFNKLIPYTTSNSSMLFSGILLADANDALNNTNEIDILDDGVLTAEEISWLDLSDTNLAVLSACETAIGRSTQEGIGGLLKAFKNAGVNHIIASLWKIPDAATAKLMISFYSYLISGEEIHSALLKAQKDTSFLYPDPYYWAGFIILD